VAKERFDIMSQSPYILLIAGSAETHSCVRASLNILADLFCTLGAQPYVWDLSEHALPLFTPGYHEAEDEQMRVERFVQQAQQANAFVLGSPVYHNSFSGILKNALDTLSPQHFHYKPVALVCNGTSDRTASLPCEHLRSIVRGLSAIAIPSQLVTVPTDFLSFECQHILTNTSLHERFAQIVRELLYFTELFSHSMQTDSSQ
jgi:azobenzene reductase